MMIILFLIFIPLLLFDLLTPHVLRKTTVFGISIPEPFIDDEQLTSFKRKYSSLIAMIQIPVITLLIIISFSLTEIQQSILMVGGLFIYLFISMILYLKLHYEVKLYKEQQGWGSQVTIVRVSSFETKFNKSDRTFPHILFLPTFLITIGLSIWLFYVYPALPDVIPTHWGIDGKPDAWSNKSFFSVFFLIFTLLFTQLLIYGMAYGIFNSSVQIKAQNSKLSLQREHEIRKLNTEIMAFINFITTLFLGILEVQSSWSILDENIKLSIVYTVPIFLILTLGSVYYYMRRSKSLNEQFKELNCIESSPGDDKHWKWGIFYFNKEDPDLFVEKKFGVGWTVNFARPGIWIFLFIVTVVPLLPIFFI